MLEPGLARAALLLVPFAATAILMVWRPPERRRAAAAMLAFLWLLPSVTLVNLLAAELGWWRFAAEGQLLLGLPFDVLLGWAVFWGPLAVFAGAGLRLWLVVALAFWIDLMVMPHLAPLAVLGDHWLLGEALALVVCLLPAQLLARMTEADVRVEWRAALQAVGFGGLMLFLLPAVILEQIGVSLFAALPREPWQVSLAFQALALCCIPGLSASQEFAQVGRGTPIPFDPPKRLVSSGPYAYLANPMQVTIVLLCLVMSLVLAAPLMLAAAVMAVVFSEGLVRWHHGADIALRFGGDWTRYRGAVRNWWPRWRPWVPVPGQLYIAEVCGPCQEMRRFLEALKPVGLEFVAGEDHPERDLERIAYRHPNGVLEETGVVAVARALEHVNLFWAYIGWMIRLPVLRQLLQLLFDAVMEKPIDRCVRRSSEEAPSAKMPDGL